MSISRGTRLAVAGGLVAAVALVAGCGSASQRSVAPRVVVPGATGQAIVIGGFGPASGEGGEQAAASRAYFRFVNDRGGVYGRRIVYKYLNDHSDPALAPSLAHQLVQQDAVFAMFGESGTGASLAVAPYLNAARVPDVFPDSSCDCLNSPGTLPYTFGWQLSDLREGKILGSYVARAFASLRVGVAYSPDPSGRDGAAGFGHEVPGRQVVARIALRAPRAGFARQATALKAAHAEVVAVFADPAVTARLSAAMAAAGYRPRLVAAAAGGGVLPDGVITDSYLPALGSAPRSGAGTWVALFRRIAGRYLPGAPFGPDIVSGMSAAYAFTEALAAAGPDPARASLISGLAGLAQGPAVAPVADTEADHGGVTGGYVGVVRGGTLVPLTGVVTTDATSAGPVTPDAGGYPAAPASGLPPH
jgi:branched-chain amino acid transport system substrate-binding protein